MSGFGDTINPYVENPFAGWIIDVHWPGGSPAFPPPRTVFALHCEGNGFAEAVAVASGTWTVAESGTEDGAASVLYGGFQSSGFINNSLGLVAFSGSNIFGANPVVFISVASGADWSMELDLTVTVTGFAPPGTADVTVTIWTIAPGITPLIPPPGFITGTITGAVLSAALSVSPGVSDSISVTVSGTAPSQSG